MATIIKQQMQEKGITVEVLLTKEEIRELGGEMENVVLFPQKRVSIPARVSLRGKKEATKYFLIPRSLRRSLNVFGSVSVQRIQRVDSDIFIYVVNKDGDRRSFIDSRAVEGLQLKARDNDDAFRISAQAN